MVGAWMRDFLGNSSGWVWSLAIISSNEWFMIQPRIGGNSQENTFKPVQMENNHGERAANHYNKGQYLSRKMLGEKGSVSASHLAVPGSSPSALKII